jgi:nucleotide-binding universal stress UspA family protein
MKIKPTKHSGEVVLEVNRRDEPLLSAAATAPFSVKRILVPMDFSECSKKALQYGLALARLHNAAITLLYVVPSPAYAAVEYGGIDYAALETQMRADGEKELATLVVDEVRDKARADVAVRTGSPANEIVEAAKQLPADLIVIATRGRTGLKHVLLGSVAEHVVRYATCPVLVVREKEHDFIAN